MKNRFTEEQIVKILNRNAAGEKMKDLSREFGVSQHTLYIWKRKFKGLAVSELKRMKSLESENARLKKLVADLSLDIVMLKDVNSRKW